MIDLPKLRTIALIVLLTSISAMAQEVDRNASKAADTYLRAGKIAVLPEGKQMLARVIWVWSGQDDFPSYSDARTLFEGMFPTDTANVAGYKRLVELRALTEGGGIAVKQYELIAYKDKSSGIWKVLAFHKAMDTEAWLVESEPKLLGDKCVSASDVQRYPPEMLAVLATPCQSDYTGLGVDFMLLGKFVQARESFQKALEFNNRSPDKTYSPDIYYTANMKVIARITGMGVDK